MILSNGVAIAPQALAETTPYLSGGYWYANDGLSLLGLHATYAAIYKTQPIVSAVVDKVADLTARLTLKVQDISNPLIPTPDTTSAYAQLIADPCEILSPYDFWHWIQATYELYGETYALKLREDGPGSPVRKLSPMHPSRTAVKRDAITGDEWFTFTVGVASAGILTVPRSEVIAYRNFNPDNVMRGTSRLESLRQTIINEDSARRATTSMWQRSAMPSMVLTKEGKLSKDAAERLKARIDQRHSGADKGGGTLVLEDGLTAAPFQLSPEAMQFIATRQLTREEVCIRMDFPPPALHILDHATFSNITEQMRSVYRDSMAPRLEKLESTLDFDLRPDFFGEPVRYAQFDLDQVLRGDIETRASVATELVTNGIGKPEEVRPWFSFANLGEDSPASKLYANAAMQPLGTTPAAAVPPKAPEDVTAEAAAPKAEQDVPDDTVKAVPQDVIVRSLMGRVGRAVKSGSAKELRAKLVAEHKDALKKLFAQQRSAVKAGLAKKAALSAATWQAGTAVTLGGLMAATSKAAGTQVATKLGGAYNSGQLAPYIQKHAEKTAAAFNQKTSDELDDLLDGLDDGEDPDDAVDGYFDTNMESRGDRLIATLVTQFVALAGMSSAAQNGGKTKTWVFDAGTKGERADHAAMDGETVGINDTFSNNLSAPGDPAGGASDNAGCLCTMDFGRE